MRGCFELIRSICMLAAVVSISILSAQMNETGQANSDTNTMTTAEGVEDPDTATYQSGVDLAKSGQYREAIEVWRGITSTSFYYQKAQASIRKALEFMGKKLFELGVEYERTGNTKEAVGSWRAVPSESTYYEKAQQQLRRFPPAGSIVNPLKQIVFWTGVGVAGSSAAFGVLGILDNISDAGLLAEYNRYDATKTAAQYDAIWSEHLSTVYGGNIKNIICYSTAVVSLGLFAWWLLLPEYVPEAKATKAMLIPAAGLDYIALHVMWRF